MFAYLALSRNVVRATVSSRKQGKDEVLPSL